MSLSRIIFLTRLHDTAARITWSVSSCLVTLCSLSRLLGKMRYISCNNVTSTLQLLSYARSHSFHKFLSTMATSRPDNDCGYKSAIAALNSLQSNAETARAAFKDRQNSPIRNILHMNHYLKLLDITQDNLTQLKCIHVAGTKGKGSTCALTESILRSYGLKTALYTSPHLSKVRERLRINGQPISEQVFSHYFWKVYKQLESKSDESIAQNIPTRPTYFTFLTLMAFYTFHHESVDVAVIEVGVGGEFDTTNVIKEPVVTGITSLGLDHTIFLGDTIQQIAWQKSGIFKTAVPAFTVSQQEEEAMDVIIKRSNEKSVASLTVVHPLPALEAINLCMQGKVQHLNASLAIHLAACWLDKYRGTNILQTIKDADGVLPQNLIDGLASCRWPGRFQIAPDPSHKSIIYFMDGAHTKESIQLATEWFVEESTNRPAPSCQVLIFYLTGYRDSDCILKSLLETYRRSSNRSTFDHVIFTPNTVENNAAMSSDLMKVATDTTSEAARATLLKNNWFKLNPTQDATTVISTGCIADAIDYVHSTILPSMKEGEEIHALITGSLLLVGGTLSFFKLV